MASCSCCRSSSPSNNPNKCFNWFLADHIEREKGEALSIRQMVEAMVRDHGSIAAAYSSPALLAGGAMTCVMLPLTPRRSQPAR